MKIKWFEKKVDERQEMDLLKAEHFSFWCMYYMLLASIFIQYFALGFEPMAIAGEWVVFMLSSFILVAGCIRKGVWSFSARKAPGIRSCFIYSLVAMGVLGVPFGFWCGDWEQGNIIDNVAIVALNMLCVFLTSFVLFSLAGILVRKREKKMVEENMDDEDDEE